MLSKPKQIQYGSIIIQHCIAFFIPMMTKRLDDNRTATMIAVELSSSEPKAIPEEIFIAISFLRRLPC